MRIAHLTTMYPLPGDEHHGHAVARIVHALREFVPDYQNDVYYFLSALSANLLKWISPRHRIYANAFKNGTAEPFSYIRPMLQLPKQILDSYLNPHWQKKILVEEISEINCDLIHVHMCYNLSYGAALAGRKLGIPVVMTLRREMILSSLPEWKCRQLVEALKMADVIIAPSAHLAEKCRKATGRDVCLIPSGTIAIFDEKPPADLDRKRRVLFVGQLEANKGIDPLVRTSIKLFNSGINFELFIIGNGPLHEKLKTLAANYPQIKFLGQLDPLEVRRQMRESQVLCVPSYTETLGLVFIEAMKQGLAVIGRKGTGIDGMGRRGSEYEVIDKDEDLYDVLPAVLNNADFRKRLAEGGSRFAEKLTWKNAAIEHRRIYDKLVH